LRRKDKESLGGTSAEALTVRGRSPNQRGGNRSISKLKSRYGNRSLTRDLYAFCKQTDHWKNDCPELKKKNKLKEKSRKPSEVNVTKPDGNKSDSSAFTFYHTVDMSLRCFGVAIGHRGYLSYIPRREWFF